MYAIIKSGGKQYKVSEGDILDIDKLSKEPKDTIEFADVLAVSDGKTLQTGKDIAKAKVTAKVIVEGRDKKVIIYKKRRRKDSKLKKGFRRSFTKIRITKIAA
ncbi:LSU ribosomal protein L21p [hydrothermal vent metagenome]|uniref:LSU ribosomal protein L21p n=1 Tax=hydrothermal vent metagenome TaxID=652676 RepID=A0A3B1E6D8_9ZZZZ